MQVVTSEPEISITELVPEDRFLLIASDGVWSVMNTEEAIQYVYNRCLLTHSTIHSN